MAETTTSYTAQAGTIGDEPPFGITFLLVFFLAVHLVTAWLMPLNIDESYAVVVSRQPTLAFFDHPMLAFSLAQWAAQVFGSEANIVVRLPYVLLGTGTTWLVWSLTRRFSTKAAIWAALLFAIAPFFGVASNQFVGPDGPLNFFMLLAIWFVFPAAFDKDTDRPVLHWALGGAAVGVAMLSKYHAVVFTLAALIALLALPSGRQALRTPGPWIAAAIAGVMQLPTVIWNMQHEWASILFHVGRVGTHSGLTFDLAGLIGMQFGQMGFFWPVSWVFALLAIIAGFRQNASEERKAYAIMAAAMILFFDAVALAGSQSPPHWSMPGFVVAMPLIGVWCTETASRVRRYLRPLFWLGFSGILLILSLATWHMRWGLPFTDHPVIAETEARWDTSDWTDLAPQLRERGIFPADGEYAYGLNYSKAGKIGYALGPDVTVYASRADPRHFAYLQLPPIPKDTAGYAFEPAKLTEVERRTAQFERVLNGVFATIEVLPPVMQTRGGTDSFAILVFRVSDPR
jgi:4-amino-4-deoxy-L-arabinose transferase-like glycosyltransferase